MCVVVCAHVSTVFVGVGGDIITQMINSKPPINVLKSLTQLDS